MQKLTHDKKELEKYLKNQAWIKKDEDVLWAKKPGEGNMNFTQRIKTESRSFIIKQSRNYVEKYPQVAAPEERVLQEAEFYELTSTYPTLKKRMPKLLHLDKENHVMCLEDLGDGRDFTFLFQQGNRLSEAELRDLMDFVSTLHTQVTTKTTQTRLSNRAMRKLNYEHIFEYPYVENNGLNLNDILPGLQAIGDKFKEDQALHTELKKLGELYLSDGKHLLHGDFFPGSWLKTKEGVKIIDPEFCFFGLPEFEMGVFFAHLKMADQSKTLQQKAREIYAGKVSIDWVLCEKFTAVEILRRILGLAQLPLEIDLEHRENLLEEARRLLVC
jgi:5-methylthioribose kinase